MGHEFYCADVSGARGEIVQMRRRLTPDDLTTLSTNPGAEQQVCPGGRVLCRRCSRLFPGDKPSKKPPLPRVDPQTFFK